MIEKILIYERDAFFALNGSDSAFLDRFMWIFTGKAVWLPLAVLILLVLIYKKNWRESLLILLAIVLVITLCDQFASHICNCSAGRSFSGRLLRLIRGFTSASILSRTSYRGQFRVCSLVI